MKGWEPPPQILQMMAQRRALDRLLDGAELDLCMADVAAHPVAISSMLSVMSCLASPTVSSCWTSAISVEASRLRS